MKTFIRLFDNKDGICTDLSIPCPELALILADRSHDYELDDWPEQFFPNSLDLLKKFNDLAIQINAECPDLDCGLIDAMMKATFTYSIFDEEFSRKLTENDYFLQQVPRAFISAAELSYREEAAAAYLATVLAVPFGKNITQSQLDSLKNQYFDVTNWYKIWFLYERMGFKCLYVNGGLYVFHWGNAK